MSITVKRKDGVLVYTGALTEPVDIPEFIKNLRKRRIEKYKISKVKRLK